MFLKNAEQTGLQLYRHFSDLIQKNSPILGRFEQAGFSALGCAGKCTGFIPKQFTLQQRWRKCRAVDRQKGAVPSRRVPMDDVGKKLLTGTALPQQQRSSIRLCYLERSPFANRQALAGPH